MLIAIEGPDGAGKTTQCSRLAGALRAEGARVVEVREPGGTALGERLRAALLALPAVDERAALFLFLASRAQLCAEVIRPALAEGAVVVADRFYASTAVYQGAALAAAGGEGGSAQAWMERIVSLSRLATGGLEPDLTILLDLSPEAALARVEARGEPDRLDRRPQDEVTRLVEGYRAYARFARERVEVVDADRAPDEVAREVKARVRLAAAMAARR